MSLPFIRPTCQFQMVPALLLFCMSCLPLRAADTYRIVHTYPHDAQAFTQGLIFLDGHLYESTGIKGQSSLRVEDVETGRILSFHEVPDKYFAEGLTNWGSTLIQLTWQSTSPSSTTAPPSAFSALSHYDGEGWGLTQDGKNLILSDGTATLRFLDPDNLQGDSAASPSRTTASPSPSSTSSNTSTAKSTPTSGTPTASPASLPQPARVLGWIDLTGLLPEADRSNPEAVLNGIAYDAVHDRLFVTGKLWPKLFEIAVVSEVAKPAATHHARTH